MVAQIIYFIILSLILLALTEFRDDIIAFYYHRIKWKTPATRRDYRKYHNILTENISYYKQLTHDGKAKFVNRLVDFISSKTFVGMENLTITENIKILISASAIQLTFGLENYRLAYFTTIQIYPRYFHSKLFRTDLKGGASEKGVLLFSWQDFLKGYEIPDDKYNLGLHEMAHALKLNVLKGEDFDAKFSFYLDNWLEIGSKEFFRINKKNESFLRAYGGRNMYEFFAVCVEHFFEAPSEFKKRLPDIYNHLCFLLNQDPTNIPGDYMLRLNFANSVNNNKQLVPIPKKVKTNYKYHAWHWTYSIMLFGIFGGIIFIVLLTSVTIIPIEQLLKIGAIGVLLAAVCQFNYLLRNGIYKIGDFLLYLVLGIFPSVCSLFLILNFLFRTSSVEEVYKIKEIKNGNSNEVLLSLENNAYSNYEWVRSITQEYYVSSFFPKKPTKIKIIFANGVLGYKILKRQEMVYDE